MLIQLNSFKSLAKLVICTAQDKGVRVLMTDRFWAWFAMLMLVNIPAVAVAEPQCNSIYVVVQNIRENAGSIACALFESPEGFPDEYLRYATNIRVMKIREMKAHCRFSDLPPGTYAIAIVHDENINGKIDTNSLGVPKEGYGFSNDASSFIGAPSFSAASFQYDGGNLELTINLHY